MTEITSAFVRNETLESKVRENIKNMLRYINQINYHAWADLSFALQHFWVQDQKYLWSSDPGVGYDIGVPETVRRILDNQFGGRKFISDTFQDLYEIRMLMTVGYLLGTDYLNPIWVRNPDWSTDQTGVVYDEHGRNQLEGEIRRDLAKEVGITDSKEIRAIRFNHRNVKKFVEKHGLQPAY